MTEYEKAMLIMQLAQVQLAHVNATCTLDSKLMFGNAAIERLDLAIGRHCPSVVFLLKLQDEVEGGA